MLPSRIPTSFTLDPGNAAHVIVMGVFATSATSPGNWVQLGRPRLAVWDIPGACPKLIGEILAPRRTRRGRSAIEKRWTTMS